MALGSVVVSGGMSKKTKERLMYMDGKLVWSAAMGTSGGLSATAPDTVDYAILTCTACHSGMNTYRLLNGVRVVRGAEIRAALDGKTRCAVFFNQSGGLVTVGYNSNYKTRTATYRVDGYHYY